MYAAARGELPDYSERSVGRGDAGEAHGGLVVEDEIGEQNANRVDYRSCCLVVVLALCFLPIRVCSPLVLAGDVLLVYAAVLFVVQFSRVLLPFLFGCRCCCCCYFYYGPYWRTAFLRDFPKLCH